MLHKCGRYAMHRTIHHAQEHKALSYSKSTPLISVATNTLVEPHAFSRDGAAHATELIATPEETRAEKGHTERQGVIMNEEVSAHQGIGLRTLGGEIKVDTCLSSTACLLLSH